MSSMEDYYQRRIEECQADIESLKARRDVTPAGPQRDRAIRMLETSVHDLSLYRKALERVRSNGTSDES